MASAFKKPNGRLTDDGARFVLRMRASVDPSTGRPYTLQAIATLPELAVSIGTVYNVASGRTHAWLTAPPPALDG